MGERQQVKKISYVLRTYGVFRPYIQTQTPQKKQKKTNYKLQTTNQYKTLLCFFIL